MLPEFTLYVPKKVIDLTSKIADNDLVTTSTTSTFLSLGGLNPRWNKDSKLLKWFPKIIEGGLSNYKLIEDEVVIPFHSMAGINVGHLVWDDFFPVFNLLSIFGLLPVNNRLNTQGNNDGFRNRFRFVRYILKGVPLWATCEFKGVNGLNLKRCEVNFKKFLPLMLGEKDREELLNNGVPYTNNDLGDLIEMFHESTDAKPGESPPGESPPGEIICWKKGVAGIGLLTDHGNKLHGWEEKDYEYSYNIGRGGVMREFRDFAVGNLGEEL